MEKWEHVNSDRDNPVFRMPVPGGWLYRVTNTISGAIAVAFVPQGGQKR